MPAMKRPPDRAALFSNSSGCGGGPGGRLALRELLAPARLVQTDLLAFDFAGVTGDEPCLRQRGFQLRIVIDQCARDAVPYGARLARLGAADDVDQGGQRPPVVGQ